MSKHFRLAFVTPRYADRGTVGGAETAVKLLAENAAARGHDVEILTTCAVDHHTWRNARNAGVEEHAGVRVRFFPTRPDRDAPTYLRLHRRIDAGDTLTPEEETRWAAESVHSDALYDHLRTSGSRYDWILLSPYLFGLTMAGMQAAGDRGVLIPCLHDEPVARLGVVRDLFSRAAGLIFHSEPERALAVELFGIADAPSAIVGLGFDPLPADPERFRRTFDLSEPFVLYCGRREGGKNTPLLVDYFATYAERSGRGIRLVLAGSGHVDIPGDALETILDLDYLEEQEKRDAMAAARVFIQPSVNESFSIVIMEAWLAGTPALVHGRCRVTRDHCVRAGGGLYFEDYPEFETCLDRLLDDEELRARLADGGRRYVDTHYTWPAVMERFETALRVFDR